jgi:hypothetical protein
MMIVLLHCHPVHMVQLLIVHHNKQHVDHIQLLKHVLLLRLVKIVFGQTIYVEIKHVLIQQIQLISILILNVQVLHQHVY